MKPTIQCSKCGKREIVILHSCKNDILNLAREWKSYGSALYCPDCAKECKNIDDNYEHNLVAILAWINRDYKLVPRGKK